MRDALRRKSCTNWLKCWWKRRISGQLMFQAIAFCLARWGWWRISAAIDRHQPTNNHYHNPKQTQQIQPHTYNKPITKYTATNSESTAIIGKINCHQQQPQRLRSSNKTQIQIIQIQQNPKNLQQTRMIVTVVITAGTLAHFSLYPSTNVMPLL